MENLFKNTTKLILLLSGLLFFSTHVSMGQEVDSYLHWLNVNSSTTYRTADYPRVLRRLEQVGLHEVNYSFKPYFTKEGIVTSNRFGRKELAEWHQIYTIGITATQRVIFAWLLDDDGLE